MKKKTVYTWAVDRIRSVFGTSNMFAHVAASKEDCLRGPASEVPQPGCCCRTHTTHSSSSSEHIQPTAAAVLHLKEEASRRVLLPGQDLSRRLSKDMRGCGPGKLLWAPWMIYIIYSSMHGESSTALLLHMILVEATVTG